MPCCHESPELDAPPSDGQNLLLALQFEQVGFVLQPAAESGQFARRTDYTMAGNYDGNWISSVGRSDCSRRSRIAELPRQFSIGPRLSKRNCPQRFPNVILKFGSGEVQLQRKRLAPPLKVLFQLPFRFEENGMIAILNEDA